MQVTSLPYCAVPATAHASSFLGPLSVGNRNRERTALELELVEKASFRGMEGHCEVEQRCFKRYAPLTSHVSLLINLGSAGEQRKIWST